jgi:hypothetical protein
MEIQTRASDITQTPEMIEEILESKLFDHRNFADAVTVKELEDIATRLWKIEIKLDAEIEDDDDEG